MLSQIKTWAASRELINLLKCSQQKVVAFDDVTQKTSTIKLGSRKPISPIAQKTNCKKLDEDLALLTINCEVGDSTEITCVIVASHSS
jgi:hypothetical protein